MELRDYLKIIAKRIWFFLVVILLVSLASYLFTVKQPVSYDSSVFVNVVVKPSLQPQSFYEYDNYYSIQASSLFTETIIAWLQDPANIIEIYNQAKVKRADVKLKDLAKLIQTRKKPSATVQINLNRQDKLEAENLINSTVKLIQDKTKRWSEEGLVKDIYIDASSPVTIEHKPPIWQNTLIGLVGGVISGLALLFLLEYLTKPSSRSS